MCGTIAVVAWDGLIIVGIILLILWILSLTNVIHIQTAAVVFIIAWIFCRFCYHRRRGRTVVV
ncbi:MAG: hypothetical protein JOS17DRAFT_795284 [Linnemannia elongata]|nr:MAG: hypothetical protein JOS17DRAFT_795284 [Linnemannia elongata]